MRPVALPIVHAENIGTHWRITSAEGVVHEVPPVTAAVHRAADGRTDLAGLLDAARTVDPGAGTADVWAALDALADAGLLASRAAPPAAAGLDRRTAIRTLAVAAGAVLAILPRGAHSEAPVAARKKATPVREQDEKKMKVAEETHKGLLRGEETAKREIEALTLKAKEEEEKLAPAIRNDPAALKQREQDLKNKLAHPGEKANEQKRKAEAIAEEMDKAQ